MTVRHILLAAVAALVLGLGIYLFFEVRAKPAAAEANFGGRSAPQPRDPDGDTGDTDPAADPVKPTKPTLAAGSGSNTNPMGGRLIRRPHQGGKLTDVPASDPEVAPPPDPGDLMRPQKLDIVMSEANKAYDRGDFDDARAIAQKVLLKSPGNARMLRILVSAACIEGDGPEAQKHFGELSPADREQMKTRCSKYGVTFTDPPK